MSSTALNLKFESFKKEHFETYKNWFKNDVIKEALYFIDEEWLEYVLKDTKGIEYVVLLNDEILAVVGIEFPSEDEKYYGITNLAINPTKFRKGYGSAILKELYKIHPLEKNEAWLAFVEYDNISAKLFFEKNGWTEISCDSNKEEMYRFEKK